MKQPLINREHGLHAIAAAVLMALGSIAVAQEPGEPGSELQQDQPEQQDRQSQRDQESELQTAQADDSGAGGGGALDQIAEENDDLSTFVEAVKAAGMEDSLTGSTEYTVFAPTNEAWEQMSGMSKDELMQSENREQLISLLRAHIVADDVDEQMARSLQVAQTIDGGTVDLSATEDEIQVGDAQVVGSDIQEGNLRVYAIDQVLMPTALARADDTGLSEQQDRSESGRSDEGSLSPERESDVGSERETDIGSDRDSPFESDTERDSPFGSDTERDSPFGSDTERDDSGGSPDPFGN